MQKYEKAVNKFIKRITKKFQIIGAIMCGSYITGNTSKRSDIDLHLILPSKTKWKERGNKIIDGFLIEYFINTPESILKYFQEDFNQRKKKTMVQFLTGKIVFEKNKCITKLKIIAKTHYNKKFPQITTQRREQLKYQIWDLTDNVLDAYEKNEKGFDFIYYNALFELYKFYLENYNYPLSNYHQIQNILTDTNAKKKYLLDDFPDKRFSLLFLKALSKKSKIDRFKDLQNHVLKKLGGFKIDGWRNKIKK